MNSEKHIFFSFTRHHATAERGRGPRRGLQLCERRSVYGIREKWGFTREWNVWRWVKRIVFVLCPPHTLWSRTCNRFWFTLNVSEQHSDENYLSPLFAFSAFYPDVSLQCLTSALDVCTEIARKMLVAPSSFTVQFVTFSTSASSSFSTAASFNFCLKSPRHGSSW